MCLNPNVNRNMEQMIDKKIMFNENSDNEIEDECFREEDEAGE